MFTLVIGGSASGKSEYAERLVLSLGGSRRRIYIAAMEPFGAEARERIARHQAMRRGRGFETVECYRDLHRAVIPAGASVLLEDMGNLAANELFGNAGAGAEARTRQREEAVVHKILQGVDGLQARCSHLTVVTNEIFSGGRAYAGETLRYLRILAAINRALADRADRVVEVECGIPCDASGIQGMVPEMRQKVENLRQKPAAAGQTMAPCAGHRQVENMEKTPAAAGQTMAPCAGHRQIENMEQTPAAAGQTMSPCAGRRQVENMEQKPDSGRKRETDRTETYRHGGTGMIFVTGPLFAGKQDYIMGLLGWDEEEFARYAVRDVQDLAAQLVLQTLCSQAETAATDDPGDLGGSRRESGLRGAEELHSENDPEAGHLQEELYPKKDSEAGHLQEELQNLADQLARKRVVIATEVGGGVVPSDPVERRCREAAGRLACLLAERAETVISVRCGLPRLLKGS